MGKQYKQLTLEERERIYALKEQGKSYRAIGAILRRNHRTIAREYKRNRHKGQEYIPCKAHKISKKRAIRQRTKAPLKNQEVFLYVRDKLQEQWSPETIAGRIQRDIPHQSISHETIYRYIYGKGKRYNLQRYLVRTHKRRRKKTGRTVQKIQRHSRIPGAVSIDTRPTKANNRSQTGHFETDLMEGTKSTKTALSVTVDRKTRYTILSKVKDKTAISKQNTLHIKLKTVQSLKKSNKPIVRSITQDNGSENANHIHISKALGVDMYFCHPYASWEKGSVENMIGRIRRYIPKGTSIQNYSSLQIQWIENKLNNTPRKCLGYLTPNEVMDKEANSYKFRRFKKKKELSSSQLQFSGGALQL